MSPLIVFNNKSLDTNTYFNFVYLKPYFYLGTNKIFTIKKSHILNIDPSKKRRASRLLQPLATQMSGSQLSPLAFTYQKKLYVIFKGYYPLLHQIGTSFFEFEVYSPKTKCWTDSGNKAVRECGINSHLVLDDTIYFTTAPHVVLSFDLVNKLWIFIFDTYDVLARYHQYYINPPLTFDSDIQIIGNTVYVIPSHDMFLRPFLTHDRPFYDHIYDVPPSLPSSLHLFQVACYHR